MFRSTAAVFASLLLVPVVRAQAQLEWLSTRDWPSNSTDFGRWCAVDASGATYVAGQVYVQQQGVPPPPPTADFGVTKFNPDGSHAWSTQIDPLGGQDFAYDLALSPSGDVYIVGYASSNAGGNPALVKLNSAGAHQWTVVHALPGFARALAFDSSGQPVVVGHVYEATTNNDVWIAKYTPAGGLVWERRIDGGSNSADNGYGVQVLANDEVLVACGLAPSGDSDFGVVRLAADGSTLWSVALDGGSGANDAATHVVVSGAYVVAGGYRTAANEDWMLAELALATGAVAGVQHHGGAGGATERVRGLAVDSSGAVWVVGSESSASAGLDFGVRRYSNTGALLSAASWNNSAVNGDDSPFKLLLGGEDQAWVVGYSYQSFGSPLSIDLQVVQFDRTGAFNWARSFSTPGAADDRAWDAELAPNNRLRISGYTNGAGTGNYDYLAASIDLSEAPHGYCTPKLNSLGCAPTMSFTGAPSVAQTSGFVVACSLVRNEKSGLIFYSTLGPASAPFQGGTFCVQPPTRRTPIALSGGNAAPANDCTGAFALDMNAYAASGVDPALATAGTSVYCQTWSRDPGASFNTSLSNGLAYDTLP
jgi:uncharacterized delta-60 repeat protein